MPGAASYVPTGLPVIDQAAVQGIETHGTGVPAIAGAVGDRYWRLDTLATSNQRLYVCTVAGIAGAATWVGIL